LCDVSAGDGCDMGTIRHANGIEANPETSFLLPE
jgi:hypothetical protein